MSHPTEPYSLTKMDIAALRKADCLVVAIDNPTATGRRVHVLKENRPTESDPFASDIRHAMAAPITVHGYYRDIPPAAKCFGYVTLYHSQKTHASSVIRTLRVGDAISFEFYPDGHSNQSMARVGFHGDFLSVLVYRKGHRVAQFELTTTIGPDNSARMCKGLPIPDWYSTAANEAA